VLVGLTLLIARAPGSAHAAEPTAVDVELAKAHFKTGEIYYEARRYPDAAREFEEAFRLSRRAEFLYNMGRSYDRVGDAVRALSAYRRFLAAIPNNKDVDEVKARIQLLQHQVARLEVSSTVDGAAVRIDGAVVGAAPLHAFEVSPGKHDVEVAREGYGTWRSSIAVNPDEDLAIAGAPVSLVKVIRVETGARAVPVYKRWWPWTLGAVVLVAAGGVTAGVLGARAGSGPPTLHLPPVQSP
jgi:tetratricopeptide (TPR) repeat protein